jgi:hypothetical protein
VTSNMRTPDYLETLNRYGLSRLLRGGDLQLTAEGNIAVTADGDLQFGDTVCNAIFRLVQAWIFNQPTLGELFEAMLSTSERLKKILGDRRTGVGASLSQDASAYHQETTAIGDHESSSAIYAGTICLVLNDLLQQFKSDLGPTTHAWEQSGPSFGGYSIGEVFRAAANNFRHHDEWARTPEPTDRQLKAMNVLWSVLEKQPRANGVQRIRENVCREILLAVSARSEERMHELVFEFATSLCDLQRSVDASI